MSKVQYKVIKVDERGRVLSNVVSLDTMFEAETVVNKYLKNNTNSIYEIHKVIPLVQIKRKIIPVEVERVSLDFDNKEQENKV